MVAIILITFITAGGIRGDTLTTRKMVNNYYIFYNPPAVIIQAPVYPFPFVVPVPVVIYGYPVQPAPFQISKGVRHRISASRPFPGAGIKPGAHNARQIRAR